MSINYSLDVASTAGFGGFPSLIRRWVGGVYIMMLPEFICFLTIYYSIRFLYTAYIMHDETFDILFKFAVKYSGSWGRSLPVGFVMGFHIWNLVSRWWAQYMTIPFPDDLCLAIGAAFHQNDERTRLMKRAIVRYCVVAYILAIRHISPQGYSRYPTLQSIKDQGLLLQWELDALEHYTVKANKKTVQYGILIAWAIHTANLAEEENRIWSELIGIRVKRRIIMYKLTLRDMINYSYIRVPRIYITCPTLIVYLYFASMIMGHQFVGQDKQDLFFPWLILFEFPFYMGLFKTAEAMCQPYGDSSDDFDLNFYVDRNMKVGFTYLETLVHVPKLVKDRFWHTKHARLGVFNKIKIIEPNRPAEKKPGVKKENQGPKIMSSVYTNSHFTMIQKAKQNIMNLFTTDQEGTFQEDEVSNTNIEGLEQDLMIKTGKTNKWFSWNVFEWIGFENMPDEWKNITFTNLGQNYPINQFTESETIVPFDRQAFLEEEENKDKNFHYTYY